MADLHIPDFLERPASRRFAMQMLALCGTLTAIEGIDIYVAGSILLILAQRYGVTPADLVIVLVAQGIGQVIGSYLLAPLADRWGRRPVILWSVLGFGLFTLVAAFAPSIMFLAVIRFFALAFVGAAQPNLFAMVSEFAPISTRGRFLMAIGSIHALGAGAAATVAVTMAGISWNAPFLLCGAFTLLAVTVSYFLLPESLEFMAARGERDRGRIVATIRRIDPQLPLAADTNFTINAKAQAKSSPILLFYEGRLPVTLLIWLIACCSLPLLSSIAQWLPTFLHIYAQMPLATAAQMVSLSGVTGALWPLLLSLIMERIGVARGLSFNLLCGAAVMAGFSIVGVFPWMGWLIGLGLGAFVAGSVSGVYTLAALSYPPEIRATGLGWAIGAGRTVAIVLPMLGGAALTSSASAGVVGLATGIPLLIGAAACFTLSVLRPHLRKSSASAS